MFIAPPESFSALLAFLRLKTPKNYENGDWFSRSKTSFHLLTVAEMKQFRVEVDCVREGQMLIIPGGSWHWGTKTTTGPSEEPCDVNARANRIS